MVGCSPAAAEALGASLCWVVSPHCQRGDERQRQQRPVGSCVGVNSGGFACSPLEGMLGSDLFPGPPALLARECGPRWRAWPEDWLSPTPSSQDSSRWLLLVPSGWGCPCPACRSMSYCGVPSPSAAQHPSSTWGLAPFFKQLLSLRENQQ